MTIITPEMNGVQDDALPSDRRRVQRRRLIACAEDVITSHGLEALRARDLAAAMGCSVGAIYNLVADLDELTLLVGQRTMADLHTALDSIAGPDAATPEAFVALALGYCRFAAENRNRWRALFEFRMKPGLTLPDWFAADQIRLFARLERRLALHRPETSTSGLALRARTLFSAVHGIVALGLEEKIVAMPISAIEAELASFVRTYLAGLDA